MVGGRADHQLKIVPLGPWMGPMCGPYVPLSDVARVAKLGGQAGGKGLHQGGKRTRETRSAVDISPLSAKQCSQ